MKTANRFFTLVLIAGLALLCAARLQAAPATASLSWTEPTMRADGVALAPAEIAGYRIYQAIDGEVSSDAASDYIAVTGELARVVTIELVPRPEPYVLAFGVRAVDAQGRVSALSNIATKAVRVESTAAPGAPTSVRFEIDCTAGCVITVVE